MAQQLLNVGSSANDGTGDTLRAAMIKTNENFTELYNSPLLASGIIVEGNEIRATRTNDDLVLTNKYGFSIPSFMLVVNAA